MAQTFGAGQRVMVYSRSWTGDLPWGEAEVVNPEVTEAGYRRQAKYVTVRYVRDGVLMDRNDDIPNARNRIVSMADFEPIRAKYEGEQTCKAQKRQEAEGAVRQRFEEHAEAIIDMAANAQLGNKLADYLQEHLALRPGLRPDGWK